MSDTVSGEMSATLSGLKGPNPTPPPPQTVVAAVEVDARKIELEIENWWRDEFHGSVLAQNTRLLNFVRAAVDRLKARL